MPDADSFEWPQGQPLFEVMWRAVTESLAGNGIVDNGDLEITDSANNMEIEVSPGTAFYIATEYSLGSIETHTLTEGDADNDRWDTVYFDTSTSSSGVREGTPEVNPEPPDIQGSELLLGFVYVPATATNVSNTNILNWRATFSNEAQEVHYDDSQDIYSVDNVADALNILDEASQLTGYPLPNDDIANSSVTVNSGTGLSTTQAQISLGSSATISISENGVTLTELNAPFALQDITDGDLGTDNLTSEDGTHTVYDNTEDHVPRPRVDDHRDITTVSTATYTTSDEEVILVDTAAIAGASTITLASADSEAGNVIAVCDSTGEGEQYPITVETEGSETINGEASVAINSDNGTQTFVSQGTNWTTLSDAFSGVTVSDDGAVVLPGSSGLNFGTALDVTDDGDNTTTVDANVSGKTVLASGTFVHTGGDSTEEIIEGVTSDQTKNLYVELGVETDPAFSADYGIDYERYFFWDDSDGQIDVEINATWSTDPGTGNDVTLDYEIYEIEDQITQGVGTEDSGTEVISPARSINFGNGLNVTDDGDETVTVDSSGVGPSSTKIHPSDGTDLAQGSGTLPIDETIFDDISGITVDLTNNELEVTEDGLYEISHGVEVDGGSDRVTHSLMWRKNGNTIPGSLSQNTYSRNTTHDVSSSNAHTTVKLNSGDIVTLFYQEIDNDGGSHNVNKSTSAITITKLS